MPTPSGRARRYAWRLIALALVVACTADEAWAQQTQVLVLYSTRRDAQIATVGDRDLPRILEEALEAGLDYYAEYLDQARFSHPAYQEAFREFLAVKYGGLQLDLVIAMGELSLAFAAVSRDRLFRGIPLVFFSERPVARPANATGIIAELNFGAT